MNTINIKRQQGAVLVVGLLLMLLATFLTVAAMNNAGVQERMAANTQNENIAFQAAESAVDDQIKQVMDGDTSRLSQAKIQETSATPTWPTASYNAGDSDISTTVEIRGMGEAALSAGNSMDADESSARLGVARFEMRSISTIAGSGARVSIIQGLEYR